MVRVRIKQASLGTRRPALTPALPIFLWCRSRIRISRQSGGTKPRDSVERSLPGGMVLFRRPFFIGGNFFWIQLLDHFLFVGIGEY